LRTPNRSRAFAQPCRSRYQDQPQLRYNIHAGPGQVTQRAQWDEADGRSILVSCAGIGRPVSRD
jgi:hypothetical protein